MSFDNTLDIAEMLADFGEAWTINGSSVIGILQNEYEAQSVFGVDVDSATPLMTVATSDVAGVVRGDTVQQGSVTFTRVTSDGDTRVTSDGDTRVVVAAGTLYYIHSIQEDGTGVTALALGRDNV
jgi:hypothetical protein